MTTDWETWLVEDAGARVIERRAGSGHGALLPVEQLTYCLWVADYGMRNAGDLATARDLYPAFQNEATRLATDLGLGATAKAFSLDSKVLEVSYFERFDEICSEVATALASSTSEQK